MEDVRRPAPRGRHRPALHRQRGRRPRGPRLVHGTERPRAPQARRIRPDDLRAREPTGQAGGEIGTPEGLIARRADTILVTVGRRPNTDDLHAEVAGVEFGPRGYVKVDRQLRTSNPHVFAIGDVIGPPFLAHKATKEGVTAAEVIAGHPVELDVHAMPAAIFTDPEIATVGLQEPEATAQARRTRVGKVPFAAIGRAL